MFFPVSRKRYSTLLRIFKDFRAPDFHVCFYYSQLFWQKSEFAFIILTFGSSPEVAFLNKIRVFALKYPQKIFACGGHLLFLLFQNQKI